MLRRVGPYELVKEIGRGGMGTVWLGQRWAVGEASKSFAVKLIDQRLTQDPRDRRRFEHEAKVNMRLSHSNVVQVFDAGYDGEQAYLVMEWVDGGTLAEFREHVRQAGMGFPFEVAAYVVAEVARGLDYAYNLEHGGEPQKLVHRDVTPQNVLVSQSGEVKLGDFGIARVFGEDTTGGHIRGKIRYMAPEQLEGKVEQSIDIFGLGALLHELLSGEPFRPHGTEAELLEQVREAEVPPLEVIHVPADLELLRHDLLARDPQDRPQTAAEVIERLKGWPLYAQANDSLSDICRRFMNVTRPRSGLHEVPGK
jgi:serine/threonine protein kinase